MSPRTNGHLPKFRTVEKLAAEQSGVVSRRQLYGLGITRWEVKARVRAHTWMAIGDQSVQLHSGPTPDAGLLWAAVFQGGPRAVLDGDAALLASGLQRWKPDRIRVSVPRGAKVRGSSRFNIRQTRRWSAEDIDISALPRVRPPTAAVRGALWAKSDAAAALLLTMSVQQGIVDPVQLGLEMLRVKRDKRRRMLFAVVNDLIDGTRALGELDVIRELRRRGLPLPDQQALRADGAHRYFLDMYWRQYRLVAEIDGIHHQWAENVVADALRQNRLTMSGDTVLRLPLLGLRVEPNAFFAQIEDALRAGGWAPHPSRADVIPLVG